MTGEGRSPERRNSKDGRALVLAGGGVAGIAWQIGVLLPLRQRAFIVQSDDAARAAFGTNPLDPAVRVPALEAGLRQGQELAAALGKYWG